MLASALREERDGKDGISTPPCPTLGFPIEFTVGCAKHWCWCESVCSTLLGIFRVTCGQPKKSLMGLGGTRVSACVCCGVASGGEVLRDHCGVACLELVVVALSLG